MRGAKTGCRLFGQTMSIVTVATSFSFTACSDDVETLDNAPAANNGTVENVSKGQLLEPIALLSDSFITASDVMILNADTTFKLTDEKTFWSYTYPQDMENKKNDRVTKVLEKATEAIKAAQDKVKENLIPGNR